MHLAADSERSRIRLAPGVRLSCDSGVPDAHELIFSGGTVQLNRGAAAILELCNGSRSRDRLIADLLQRPEMALAADVGEFLDAAKARGWITES